MPIKIGMRPTGALREGATPKMSLLLKRYNKQRVSEFMWLFANANLMFFLLFLLQSYRRKKCDKYLLTLANNRPSLPLSSSLSWIWSIQPVSTTDCSRVKLYSIRTFRYLATNSACTGFESSLDGDVFQLFDPK